MGDNLLSNDCTFIFQENNLFNLMIMTTSTIFFKDRQYQNPCLHLGWKLINNIPKFVYVKKSRCLKPRKSGYTIDRLIWISPFMGELYYLRMMFTVVKGTTCYEDIRTVSNIEYATFRDTCFAIGLLKDDKEYIEAIREAKD
ncbi:hypothetical protein Lal_00030173 [Lupinus albus]|nr:hypothetical protein Lal_00030173 [Lupinus albus]